MTREGSHSESRSRGLPDAAIDRLLELGLGDDGDDAESLTSLTLGVDLGKYRIVREIGRGGMGVVFEAVDTSLGRTVALKVLPHSAGPSEVFRKRFLREAKSAARLSHPNIAAVFEATPDYIAMQFVKGRDLLETVKGKPRLAATLVRDAAEAIRYAHEEGVIHRDLKPSNMLVEAGGESTKIYVMDFGLAKEASMESSLSGSGNILGTPAYMPPEQAEGRTHDVDARSDVYGRGATLYACLTGEAPFRGKDILELLRKVSEQDARPTRIDAELDAITLKCLTKEASRRYQSAGELAEDLSRWLAGEPVLAQKPSLAYRTRKFLAKRKRILIPIGLAISVATAFGIYGWVQTMTLQQERERNRLATEAASDAAAFADEIRVMLADADAYRRQGAIADVRMTLAGGLSIVERFRERHADVAIAHYYDGLILRGIGRNEQALAALDQALELDPKLLGARVHRGFVRLAHCERLERSFANTQSAGASLVAAAAVERATRERIDSLRKLAVEDLESASAEERQDAAQLTVVDTNLRSAELSRLRGSFRVARDLLELVLRTDPTSVDAHRALAQVARAVGDVDSEREHITQANKLAAALGYAYSFPLRDEANPARDNAAQDSTRDDASLMAAWRNSDFSGWSRWNPAVPSATEYIRVPELDLVIADFEAVLARAPSDAAKTAHEAQRVMMNASRETGEAQIAAWRKASELLAQALASDDKLAAAHCNRALCWLQIARQRFDENRASEALGAENSARRDLQRALELDALFAPAFHARALLELDRADRLARFGRFRQSALSATSALQDLTRAAEVVPAASWIRVTAARGHLQRARMRIPLEDIDAASQDRYDAQRLLQLVLTNSPDDPHGHYQYALLLRDLGKPLIAREQCQQALAVAPERWRLRSTCQDLLKTLAR